MSDNDATLKLDIDTSSVDREVKHFTTALDEVTKAAADMYKQMDGAVVKTGETVEKAAARVKNVKGVIQEASHFQRQNVKAMAEAAKAGNEVIESIQLNLVRNVKRSAQQAYEEMATMAALQGKAMSDAQILGFKREGASLLAYHKERVDAITKAARKEEQLLKQWLVAKDEHMSGARLRQKQADTEALQQRLAAMSAESAVLQANAKARYKESLGRGGFNTTVAAEAAKESLAAKRLVDNEALAATKAHNDKQLMYTKLWIGMEQNERKQARGVEASATTAHLAALNNQLKAYRQQQISDEARLQAALQGMDNRTAEVRAANALDYKRSLARGTFFTQQAGRDVRSGGAGAVDIPDTGKLTATSRALKMFTVDANDAHSAARGLASGFGLLWLTWGNMVPLLAGAAVSNGFMQTVKVGSQVADTLTSVAVLAGNTAEEMGQLQAVLLDMGRSGVYGPLALADAMKVLSLAGLKATDVIGAIKDVSSFSLAGATDMKTAAESLVSISTAFGMGAEGFGIVADMVSKGAAESKVSVESFSEAMKTASVVHKQYGVSLKDTTLQISMLAQLGIQGTAAGTAVRNMYADLSGRTPQVAKALKQLGVELYNANGKVRPLLEVVADLDGALSKLTATEQNVAKQRILSERGAKGMIEALDEFRSKTIDGSNALQGWSDKLEDRFGFAAISAARMGQSVAKQFDAVKASMQTSFFEAFKSVEPQIFLFEQTLKQALGSKEFTEALANLAKGVVHLAARVVEVTGYFVEHKGVILSLLGVYVSIRTATAAWTALTVADTVATTANTAAHAANGAAKLGTLGRLAGFIPGLGTAVKLAAGAWALYTIYQGTAIDKSAEYADKHASNVISELDKEIARLEAVNVELAKGLTLKQAHAAVNAREEQGKALSPEMMVADNAIAAQAAAVDKLTKAKADLAKIESTNYKGALAGTAKELLLADAKEAVVAATKAEIAASKAATEAVAKEMAAKGVYEERTARVAKLKKAEYDKSVAEAEAATRELVSKFGKGTFNLDGTEPNSATQKAYAQEQKAFDAFYNQQMQSLKTEYDKQQFLLDSKHKNALISEGEFQAQSLANIVGYEQEATKARDTALAKRGDLLGKRVAQVMKEVYKTPEGRSDAIQKALDDFNVFAGKLENEAQTQTANATKRTISAVTDSAGEVIKITRQVDAFLVKNSAELAASMQPVVEVFDRYAEVGAKAAAEQSAKFAGAIHQVSEQAKEAAVALDAMEAAGLTSIDAEAKLLKLIALLERLKVAQGEAVATAATNAVNKAKAADFKNLVSSIAGAITKGGEEGATELRNILEQELLRKPFKIWLEGTLGSVANAMSTGNWAGVATAFQTGLQNLSTAASNVVGTFGAMKNVGGSLVQGLDYVSGALVSANYVEAGVAVQDFAFTVSEYSEAINTASDTLGYLNAAMLASEERWGAAIGAGIGTYFGGAVGSWVGQKVGSYVDTIFGGGTSYSKGGGIEGTFGPQGFSGSSYSIRRDDPNKWNSWMGESGKDVKTSTAMGAGQASEFSNTFTAIKNSTLEFAKSLGLSTQAVNSYTSVMKIETMDAAKVERLNWNKGILASSSSTFAEKTAARAEIQAIVDEAKTAVGEFFKTMRTEMAATVVNPDFIRQGEDADVALARMAISLATVNGAMRAMEVTLYEVSQAGGNAASDLIDAFGGLETFTSTMQGYFSNYYTEAERLAMKTTDLTEAFANLGIVGMPKTRAEFRALAEQLAADPTRKQLYADLMKLQGAFAEVVPAVNETTEALDKLKSEHKSLVDTLWELTGNIAAQRSATLAALSPESRELQNAIWAIEDAKAAHTAAVESAKSAYDLAKAASDSALGVLQQLKEAADANYSAAVSATDAALSAVKRIRDTAEATYNSAKTATDAALDTVRRIRDNAEATYKTARDFTDAALANLLALKNEAESSYSAAKSASDNALSALERSINKQKAAAQSAVEDAAKATAKAKDLFNGLTTALDDLGDTIEIVLAKKVAGQLAIANAVASPGTPLNESILTSAKDVRAGFGATDYTSQFAESRDKLVLANQLEVLAARAGDTVTAAEAAEANAKATLDTLTLQYETAKQSLDVLRGIDISVVSVEQALTNLQSAMQNEAEKSILLTAATAVYDAGKLQVDELRKLDTSVLSLKTALSQEATAKLALDAANTALTNAEAMVASIRNTETATKDLNTAMGNLATAAATETTAKSALDAANLAVASAQASVDTLRGISTATTDIATAMVTLNTAVSTEATAKEAKNAADAAYMDAKEQLENIRGINKGVLDLNTAIANFAAAAATEVTTAAAFDAVQSAYSATNTAILGAIAAAEAIAARPVEVNVVVNVAAPPPTIITLPAPTPAPSFTGMGPPSPGTNTGWTNPFPVTDTTPTGGGGASETGLKVQAYAVGTNYVPNTGLAYLHEGEAVVPKAFNPSVFGSTMGNSEEVASLLRELISSFTSVDEQTRAAAIASAKTLKLLDRVIPEGDYMAVKSV